MNVTNWMITLNSERLAVNFLLRVMEIFTDYFEMWIDKTNFDGDLQSTARP